MIYSFIGFMNASQYRQRIWLHRFFHLLSFVNTSLKCYSLMISCPIEGGHIREG